MLSTSARNRTSVTPAVVIGRTAQARVRIFEGDIEGGLAQLDEVGTLLMSGGADPLTTAPTLVVPDQLAELGIDLDAATKAALAAGDEEEEEAEPA